jgi:II/X family phage/plasmid replication protein
MAGTAMIDWIKAVIPLNHDKLLSAGKVYSVSGDTGEIEWAVEKRLPVAGSFESKVHVRSVDPGHVVVDGNPAKFLQGHNIFGPDDLRAVAFHFFMKIAHTLGLDPTNEDIQAWHQGDYELKRVDATESFRLPSQDDVTSWLRAAASTARGKHQAASAYSGETIYLGKNSRRISLKIYSKYLELKKHHLPKTLPFRNELLEHAKGLLRAEVRLLSMELKRRRLDKGSDWNSETLPFELVKERIETMKLNQKIRLTANELDDLPPRLRMVYRAWSQGEDLRTYVPRSSFYRYRSELLEHGVDISAPSPGGGEVIPLVKYLTAEHRNEVPEFLHNSQVCFKPRLVSL